MTRIKIDEIISQATPHLTFKNSSGGSVPGSSIIAITYRQPNMSQTTGATVDVKFHDDEIIPTTPDTLDRVTYTNRSQADQTQKFTRTYESKSTFSWSLSQQLELGVENTIGGSFAFVQAEIKLTVKLTIGSQQSWATEETESLSVDMPITVPPMSIVTATWVLQRLNNVLLNFTATYRLSGTISFEVLTATGELSWSGSAGDLIAASIKGGNRDDWTVSGTSASLNVRGTLVANAGVNALTTVDQTDLEGNPVARPIVKSTWQAK